MIKFSLGVTTVIAALVGSTFVEGGYIGHALIFTSGFLAATALILEA